MATVAIGRFDHQVAHLFDAGRSGHHQVMRSAEVTGKQQRGSWRLQCNECRAKNMAGWQQTQCESVAELNFAFELDRTKQA